MFHALTHSIKMYHYINPLGSNTAACCISLFYVYLFLRLKLLRIRACKILKKVFVIRAGHIDYLVAEVASLAST